MQSLLVMWLCLLLLTVAVKGQEAATAAASIASKGDISTSGEPSPEIEAAADWVLQHGGEINVVIRTLPNRGRKMYANKDFAPGDVLMKIPLSVSFTMYPEEGEELWAASANQLYAEMHNPDSHLQVYFKTLPTREMVWSFYDIPESYLPLIQSKSLEENIASLQTEHVDSTEKDKEVLRYTLSLLETRTFGTTDGEGLLMLPVMDMADHVHGCTHHYSHDDCGGSDEDEQQECIIFNAGQSLKKGDEICIGYREHLAQDASLLQYGFLQDGVISEMMSRVDRHDFNPEDPWLEPPYKDFAPKSPEEALAEIQRLQQLKAELQARDAELKGKISAHPRDVGGRYLGLLWTWRAQRQAAIEKELARLSKVLDGLEATIYSNNKEL